MPNYNEVITSHWSQWPSSKRSTKNNTAEDVQKRESSYSLSGNVNSEATMENSMEVPWKTKHRGIIWSRNPFPGLDLEKFIIWNDMCTPIFRVALFTTAKTWNSSKCPVTEKWRLRGTSINWNTTQSKNRKNNDIGNSIDVPRNYHKVRQGEKDKYPKISCIHRIYKFIPIN